jgi:hypothetical protein
MEESMLDGVGGHLCARVHAELVEDAAHVSVDRPLAEEQLRRDRAVGLARVGVAG